MDGYSGPVPCWVRTSGSVVGERAQGDPLDLGLIPSSDETFKSPDCSQPAIMAPKVAKEAVLDPDDAVAA
jgi:hypothetical protein